MLAWLGLAGTAQLQSTRPWGISQAQAQMPAQAPPAVPSPRPVDASRLACTVDRIVDGDTLDARCAGERHRVRLLRVNTPERGKPGYREASKALSEIVGTGEIALEFEKPGTVERDGFGRMLAYVYRGERMANLEIVRQGWSTFWTRYGAGRLPTQFARAESEARTARAGMWDPKRFASPPPDAKPDKGERPTKADLPPVGNCRPRQSCCRVCKSGKPCGDSCIGPESTCSRDPGCACGATDVCS